MSSPKEGANALIANIASQRKNSTRKTSRRSGSSGKNSKRRVAKSEDLKTLKAKSLEPPVPFPNNTKEDQTNADIRLSQFMRGERRTIINGEEHSYDSKAMRTYTLEEVGSIMGVTRERVRQIEEAALRKMWRALDSISRREGITKAEWMAMLTNGNAGDSTVYMP